LVTNRKPKHRRGKVQLIDATRHFQKMRKSLGNKRNELSEAQIAEITKLYAGFKDGQTCKVIVDDKEQERVCSKVFDNREFGFVKLTIERPLRLNFQTSPERVERLKLHSAFIDLAESKKRKDKAKIKSEQNAGRELQQIILVALADLSPTKLYTNRDTFIADLTNVLKTYAVNVPTPIRKAILTALSERDPTADICVDAAGNPEPDPDLRDTESVPLAAFVERRLSFGQHREQEKQSAIVNSRQPRSKPA
jgi:type I restriction enzyme M protein